MLSQEKVDAQEEDIRKKVRDLPDQTRSDLFKQFEREIKDPDSYAMMNYLFFTGLHHAYLGKWGRALFDLGLFFLMIYCLFIAYYGSAVMIFLFLFVTESYQLFRSQIIVQDYNNKVMERIYQRYLHS